MVQAVYSINHRITLGVACSINNKKLLISPKADFAAIDQFVMSLKQIHQLYLYVCFFFLYSSSNLRNYCEETFALLCL